MPVITSPDKTPPCLRHVREQIDQYPKIVFPTLHLVPLMSSKTAMDQPTPDPARLTAAGEFFGAGFCEQPQAPPALRYARAYRRWLEHAPLAPYTGGCLYPCGPAHRHTQAAMAPNYSYTVAWHAAVFERRMAELPSSQAAALQELRTVYEAEHRKLCLPQTPHTVGGCGYTHSIVRYDRVLAEGLNGYAERILAGQHAATNESTQVFYAAMQDLLAGIRVWHTRILQHLQTRGDTSPGTRRLIAALERVPFAPARTLYEAVVAYNFIYYLDGCDNPGRMDQVLWPYYRLQPDHEAAVALLTEFCDNISANGGWSAAIGGTLPDGSPAYQEMTEIVLEASRGRWRPSLELRVRPDMPEELWEVAFQTLASGNGQPAFHNEPGYLAALREAGLGLAEADLVQWNGGGCTETMIHGCSNVGSLDAGFNLPLVLDQTLSRILSDDGVGFETILAAFKDNLRAAIHDTLDQLNGYFQARAQHRPQPVRSLLVDDCLDRGRDFNAGGARYNWSVVNVAGIANVADSLAALRRVVFQERALSPSGLLEALRHNFDGHEPLRRRLLACPKFGNGENEVDDLAAEIADFTYRTIQGFPCVRGGRFLPSHIMFETFVEAGRCVGATPDGRRAGEPLADSAGPVQGRDRRGPTAMLRSVARLTQQLAVGTPVLNMRLSKASLQSAASRRRLRALIEGYFRLGGLQVQFSILDREALLDALVHPERHEDLIVRIGGYSVRFNWLSLELKQEVIKRTEYVL